MKVFVTGGTGFIGGHVVRKLRERGDEVRALVRTPEKGAALKDLGCELIPGSLSDADAIRAAMEGCDAVIHGAAVYEVGIPKSEHRAMYEANVVGTETVLGAALDAQGPEGRLHLDRRRLRQHPGPGRRRELRAPRGRLYLVLRGDEGRGPSSGDAADRRRGASLRHRPARRRLRARTTTRLSGAR